jgi:hypothetical protein
MRSASVVAGLGIPRCRKRKARPASSSEFASKFLQCDAAPSVVAPVTASPRPVLVPRGDRLGSQINQAVREKDEQKADALTRKINDLEKTLGPEYLAFFDALNNLDQNPKEFRDILPVFDTLNQSCPH